MGSIPLNSYDALTKTNTQYDLVNAGAVNEATVFDHNYVQVGDTNLLIY